MRNAIIHVKFDSKRMKNNIYALGIIIFALTGCGPKIHTTYDHRVDFKKYKSFCWMKGCEFIYSGPKYLSDSLVRGYFKKAIIETMKSKGVVYNADYPDLLVDVHVTVENMSEIIYHRDQEAQMSFLPLAEPEVIEFLKGTLVIDMADRNESRMVWRSEAIGYLDIHPELTEKNIRKGIERVLQDFPSASRSRDSVKTK